MYFAFGFECCIERLILFSIKNIFQFQNIYLYSYNRLKIFRIILKFSESLRSENLIVVNDFFRRSLKSQMKDANRLNVSHTIIIGDEEVENKQDIIKDMKNGNQDYIKFDRINSSFI